MSWPKIKKKNCHFKVSSIVLCSKEPFLDCAVTRDEKWILYNSDSQQQPSQSLDQEKAPKHFPKPRLALKKSYVIVWWSAACLIHCSFLNPSEAITSEKYAQQIDEMHWKLQPQQLAVINRKGPILLHKAWPHVAQPTLQRLNELGYEVLPHLPHSPDLLTTDYHFCKHLDNFLQGECSYNQQETENAFQEFI